MSAVSIAKRVADAIAAVHTAFGAPGDYGYETKQGKALVELYGVGFALAHRPEPDASEPMEVRLGQCLTACVDTALLTVRDVGSSHPIELRLGSFNEELSEKACLLLEELGL